MFIGQASHSETIQVFASVNPDKLLRKFGWSPRDVLRPLVCAPATDSSNDSSNDVHSPRPFSVVLCPETAPTLRHILSRDFVYAEAHPRLDLLLSDSEEELRARP